MPSKSFIQNSIALIYDFDKTLTPLAMQEYTVLPALGIKGEDFWKEVSEATEEENADGMLVWMRLMIEKIEENKKHIDREDFKALAKRLEYFEGVESWFENINAYVDESIPKDIELNHYLISAGLKEIIEGASIRQHFRQVYASEYHYNHHNRATFPAVLVNDTMKTQFLFRINKGKEQITESINEHMPEEDRPVPFSNMVYIGDGMSDVPSMTVTKQNGGYAIAVYEPGDEASLQVCRDLFEDGRVDYYSPADYREGSESVSYTHLTLPTICSV